MRVDCGGRGWTVDVTRGALGTEVRVEGTVLQADLVQAGATWSLLLRAAGAPAAAPARSYEVAIDRDPGGATRILVNGRAVPVGVGALSSRKSRPGGAGSDGGNGARPVVAPMPGRVVKVLVTPGQAVTARQGLVVVEAMKMENELRAVESGIVTEVRVAEGALVDTHAVLVVVKPGGRG